MYLKQRQDGNEYMEIGSITIHNDGSARQNAGSLLFRVYLTNGSVYILQIGYSSHDYIIKNDKLYKKRGFFTKDLLGEINGIESL